MAVELSDTKKSSNEGLGSKSQYSSVNDGDDDGKTRSGEKGHGALFSGIIADLNRRIFSPNYVLDWTLVDKSHLEDDPNAFVPTQSAAAIKILAATFEAFGLDYL